MSAKAIIGTTVAVAIGTLIALALAGLYVKQQLNSATAGNSTIGTIFSLFGSKPATSS